MGTMAIRQTITYRPLFTGSMALQTAGNYAVMGVAHQRSTNTGRADLKRSSHSPSNSTSGKEKVGSANSKPMHTVVYEAADFSTSSCVFVFNERAWRPSANSSVRMP